jgi:MtaA/CmuA family methyltransferase
MNGRERILSALEHKKTDCLALMPITMMLAADEVGIPYGKYATDARLLCQGQTAIAERYGFDYVSVISDPGVESGDCGASIIYYENQPPAVDEKNALLADKTRLASLKAPAPVSGKRMSNRIEGVRLLKEKAGRDLLVEGWVEGPTAESADLRGINHLMMDFIDDPDFINDLFGFAYELAMAFAREQIKAGADIIGVGDAASSLVGPSIYDEFIFSYQKKWNDGIHAMGAKTRLHICGNITSNLEKIGQLGYDMVDLDWMVNVGEARKAMGPDQVLLGNIDPVRVLYAGNPDLVRSEIGKCRNEAGSNYIVGAGCEVPRGTPRENLEALSRFAKGTRPA